MDWKSLPWNGPDAYLHFFDPAGALGTYTPGHFNRLWIEK